MPILVDFSSQALAGILSFKEDLKQGSDEKIVNLIRHVVLSSLLSIKQKFSKKYGELIICADGKSYWRRDVFPYYKASRSKHREESNLNWKLIFDTLSSLREDLEEYFPYKVICVEKAEADDIIAVLSYYWQKNELIQNGLEEEPQPVMIVSSDKDNLQLQKFKNVVQWSPLQKKQIKPEISAEHFLIEKICCGDSGDGIPNILSADDVFVSEGARQTPFRKIRIKEFLKKGIEACKTEEERRNFQRNELLISYEKIPEDIRQKIINTYKEIFPKGSYQKILQYLIIHRCKNLIDDLENF